MRTEETRALATGKYRPEIDGLRAFAVVTVIINHFNKDTLPGGYLGVDIFFVISGYVITSSLFGRPSKDFKDFITGFYERRIKRLVPALSAFVLITSIAICLVNSSPGLSLLTGMTSLFGLSNLYLLMQSTDYFAQSTELNIFTHTWSLGVEEQFYILFPFLIWLSGFGRQTKNGARNLFLVVSTLTIASLIGFLYLSSTNQPAAYFLMPSRFWEMASGCLTFIGFQQRASIEQFLEKVPPLLALALIVGVMYLPMSMASASTIAVVVLSSILIASMKKQTAAFKVFTNPKVVYIGLISYSLYLWHWGVLSISRWTIGIHWWSVPFQVALMLGLAVASYQWIETPLRKHNWFGKRWATLTIGGLVVIATSGSIYLVRKGLGTLKLGRPISTQGTVSSKEECMFKTPEECLKRDGNLSAVFAIGDSHLMNYAPSMRRALKELGIDFYPWGGTEFIRNIFLPVKGEGPLSCTETRTQKCLESEIGQLTRILDRSKFGQGDILVYSMSRNRLYLDGRLSNPKQSYEFPGRSRFGQENKVSMSLLSSAIVRLADFAISRGGKFVVIDDIPVPCGVSEFSSRFKECSTPRSISLSDRRPLTQLLKEISSSRPDIFYLDPHDSLCEEDDCKSVLKGAPLYGDNSPHISMESQFVLKDFFKSEFELLSDPQGGKNK
ncbi:acyltransferase family protein [Synechococcus lacustris]|uniref:acyltransferase family protein n=1 Tax=Synechococcus lacustris TaxID=2116544 RepID=UPI0020CFB521|nr:acyltransferase family protein [Synechococcus lacustris]MCP9814986.1 acyltransferase [Synechococcus lacustris L1E-Slac]